MLQLGVYNQELGFWGAQLLPGSPAGITPGLFANAQGCQKMPLCPRCL